jgi:hypothetical protein
VAGRTVEVDPLRACRKIIGPHRVAKRRAAPGKPTAELPDGRLTVCYDRRMKELAHLLGDMLASGVVQNYALFGATAQMRYTEPVATLDADVLVAVPTPERIDALHGIYEFCAVRGYVPEGEAIRVGAWPVQFIAAFDALTREAMEEAETADFEGVPIRVVRADHLAVIALKVGRAKDHARILALIESGSVGRTAIENLAARHGLADAWQRFTRRFLDE